MGRKEFPGLAWKWKEKESADKLVLTVLFNACGYFSKLSRKWSDKRNRFFNTWWINVFERNVGFTVGLGIKWFFFKILKWLRNTLGDFLFFEKILDEWEINMWILYKTTCLRLNYTIFYSKHSLILKTGQNTCKYFESYTLLYNQVFFNTLALLHFSWINVLFHFCSIPRSVWSINGLVILVLNFFFFLFVWKRLVLQHFVQ